MVVEPFVVVRGMQTCGSDSGDAVDGNDGIRSAICGYMR